MSRFASAFAVLALTAAGLAGCRDAGSPAPPLATPSRAPLDAAALRTLVEDNNRRFTQAHVSGDAATIDAMFTRDARSLPPGAEPVVGHAAISRLTTDYLAFGIAEFHEETTDFHVSDTLLVDQGNYRMVYGKERTIEVGKYLNVWKQEDGVWKIQTNIWNTNAAAAPGG